MLEFLLVAFDKVTVETVSSFCSYKTSNYNYNYNYSYNNYTKTYHDNHD